MVFWVWGGSGVEMEMSCWVLDGSDGEEVGELGSKHFEPIRERVGRKMDGIVTSIPHSRHRIYLLESSIQRLYTLLRDLQ